MWLLRAALAAAGRGWPVFPLAPGSKRPAVSGWPHAASVDADVLAGWWKRAPYNIGINCASARLLVVDLDGPHLPDADGADALDARAVFAALADRAGAELAATFTVATPSGGEHRYYTLADRHQARSTVGLLGRHIDTRGTGGYVVAAGSTRWISGQRRHYRIVDPNPPAPLPGWLTALLTPTTPPAPSERLPETAVHHGPGYLHAALAGEIAQVRAAMPGTRNTVLFRAAVSLGTLVAADAIDETEVCELLQAAAAPHIGADGFTAAEATRAITNGLRYGLRRPRHLAS